MCSVFPKIYLLIKIEGRTWHRFYSIVFGIFQPQWCPKWLKSNPSFNPDLSLIRADLISARVNEVWLWFKLKIQSVSLLGRNTCVVFDFTSCICVPQQGWAFLISPYLGCLLLQGLSSVQTICVTLMISDDSRQEEFIRCLPEIQCDAALVGTTRKE